MRKPLNPFLLVKNYSGSRPATGLEKQVIPEDMDYVAAALAGDVAKAASLAKSTPAEPKHIAEFPKLLNVQRLKIQTVYLSDPARPTQALATSEAVKTPDREQPINQRDGFQCFSLEVTDDEWLVTDIDFETESGVEEELERPRSRVSPRREKYRESRRDSPT